MAASGSDVRGTEAMDERDSKIAQGGQNLWSIGSRASESDPPRRSHRAHNANRFQWPSVRD